jgi:hypothetical protein
LVDLDGRGFVNFYIKEGPLAPSGGDMFREGMASFSANYTGVRGTWLGKGDLTSNFDSFRAAVAAGKTEVDAALNYTFTGAMAKKYGFTRAVITGNEEFKVVVEFTKP